MCAPPPPRSPLRSSAGAAPPLRLRAGPAGRRRAPGRGAERPLPRRGNPRRSGAVSGAGSSCAAGPGGAGPLSGLARCGVPAKRVGARGRDGAGRRPMGRGLGSVRGGAGRRPVVFLPGPFRAVRGGDCPARVRLLPSLSARTGRAAVSLKRCL